jgi:hypothetical protein
MSGRFKDVHLMGFQHLAIRVGQSELKVLVTSALGIYLYNQTSSSRLSWVEGIDHYSKFLTGKD